MNDEFIIEEAIKLCHVPRSFGFLAQNLFGVDPVFLKECLDESNLLQEDASGFWSVVRNSENQTRLFEFQSDPQLYLKKFMGHFDFLKMPHPLDFEWRNTSNSLNYLTDFVLQRKSIDDEILIIGMPTLFANLKKRDVPQRVTLVERNKPIVEALKKFCNDRFQVIEADVFKVNPSELGSYDAVFMDPPWYRLHFDHFIWLGASSLKVGGELCISVPSLNTRPNIDEERLEWFGFCQENGLCIEALYPQKLEYAMPFFEFNAFRSAGISVSPFWRKGDFSVFKRMKDKQSERPEQITTFDTWEEFEISGIRFRYDPNSTMNEDVLNIKPLIKGEILPTVSSRDKRRKRANLWTSGNRIYEVSNIQTFDREIKNIKKNNVSSEETKFVQEFVNSVVGLEVKEYNDYLESLYYEMEKKVS